MDLYGLVNANFIQAEINISRKILESTIFFFIYVFLFVDYSIHILLYIGIIYIFVRFHYQVCFRLTKKAMLTFCDNSVWCLYNVYNIHWTNEFSIHVSINIVHSLCAHGTHIQDRDILIKCVKDKKWLNFMLCIYIDYNGKHLNQNKKRTKEKKEKKLHWQQNKAWRWTAHDLALHKTSNTSVYNKPSLHVLIIVIHQLFHCLYLTHTYDTHFSVLLLSISLSTR